MDMIFLDIERTYRPGIGVTNPAEFLFDTCCNPPGQDAFAVLGTPDKVIGQFVSDMFGMLHIHTRQYNICSNSCEVPVGTALPLLER